MNVAKITGAMTCCATGTALGWWAIKGSWLLSLLTGPLQHLGLAVSRLDNSNDYLDGVSRLGGFDYLAALIQVALWLIGVGAAFLWFRARSSKVVTLSLACGWGLVGAVNVYLFAVRSV